MVLGCQEADVGCVVAIAIQSQVPGSRPRSKIDVTLDTVQALQRVRPYIRQNPETEHQKASSKAAAAPEKALDQGDAAGFAAFPPDAIAAEGSDLAMPASAAGTDAEAAIENGSGGTCGVL